MLAGACQESDRGMRGGALPFDYENCLRMILRCRDQHKQEPLMLNSLLVGLLVYMTKNAAAFSLSNYSNTLTR